MKLLVSALEHSANVHLEALTKELDESVELVGIFSSELGTPTVDMRSLAIMGIIDAIRKLRFFIKLKNEMVELAAEADKVLLMDSSGFNLPLAKAIKKRYPEKEIIYYILPQAWAWKKKRIPVLEQTIDKLASILPFEPSYYSKNAPIEYVGHPLLDEIKQFKQNLQTHNGKIVFMPGSRRSEIQKLMPVFREVRKQLDKQAVVVIPDFFDEQKVKDFYGDLEGFEISHDAHKALYESEFAFICSGTATLEASLIGIPFVLSYIAKPLDYFIVSSLAKIDKVGLGNIMFGHYNDRDLHPEFLQKAVTAENLLKAYEEYDRDRFFSDAQSLREYLKHGSSKRVAELVKEA
jgi:lipid-A-disaccharide synthase